MFRDFYSFPPSLLLSNVTLNVKENVAWSQLPRALWPLFICLAGDVGWGGGRMGEKGEGRRRKGDDEGGVRGETRDKGVVEMGRRGERKKEVGVDREGRERGGGDGKRGVKGMEEDTEGRNDEVGEEIRGRRRKVKGRDEERIIKRVEEIGGRMDENNEKKRGKTKENKEGRKVKGRGGSEGWRRKDGGRGREGGGRSESETVNLKRKKESEALGTKVNARESAN